MNYVYEIPLRPVANQEMLVVLDNQNCSLRLIQRHKRMYLSLWINNVEIWSGRICRDRIPLNKSAADDFRGYLLFADTEGTEDPQYERLGTRWQLVYVPPDTPYPASVFHTRMAELEGV